MGRDFRDIPIIGLQGGTVNERLNHHLRMSNLAIYDLIQNLVLVSKRLEEIEARLQAIDNKECAWKETHEVSQLVAEPQNEVTEAHGGSN